MTAHGLPKYTIDPETGCWNWALYTSNQTGYGVRTVAGKRWSAHRYAYVERYGPIAGEYDIHHVCHNRRCINPEHLEAVLHDEHAGASGHGKLSRKAAAEIRRLRADQGLLQRELADRFGVTRSVISCVLNGHVWKAT